MGKLVVTQSRNSQPYMEPKGSLPINMSPPSLRPCVTFRNTLDFDYK